VNANGLKAKTNSLLTDLKTEFDDIYYHLFSRNGFEDIPEEENVELVSFE